MRLDSETLAVVAVVAVGSGCSSTSNFSREGSGGSQAGASGAESGGTGGAEPVTGGSGGGGDSTGGSAGESPAGGSAGTDATGGAAGDPPAGGEGGTVEETGGATPDGGDGPALGGTAGAVGGGGRDPGHRGGAGGDLIQLGGAAGSIPWGGVAGVEGGQGGEGGVTEPPAEPTVTVSPLVAHPGDCLEQNGSGFAPGSDVQLFFRYPDETVDSALVATADSEGNFEHSYCWVTGAASPGEYEFWAVDSPDAEAAPVSYVLQPVVTVSPTSGTAGTTFEQNGSGFTPQGEVRLSYRYPNGTVNSVLVVSATVDGRIEHSFTSTAANPLGDYQYWATDLTRNVATEEVTYTFE